MNEEPTIFVVDDNQPARDSVCALVRSMNLTAESYESAEAFLADYTERPGCLVTDVRMLGMSGLELLDKLNEMNSQLPIIILTAYATTPLTVRAMQSGAITILDKPYQDDELWNAIRRALTIQSKRRVEFARRQEILDRIATLSPGEVAVLKLLVQGKANKVIARRLDVSVRTVENRRRDIYIKMRADSAAELVRMVIESGQFGEEEPESGD